ncbi:hypothetical protein ACFPK9_01270 [Rubritalea spongiae]|uniref:Uncharacterized protein n=1 Tax=Rubritalea spongiae TaxID=430797 RepID=A0ABW5DYS2_9BACT
MSTLTITPEQKIARSHQKFAQANQREAYLLEQSYKDFWGGDKAQRLAMAAGLNAHALNQGTTAEAVFAEHALRWAQLVARDPSFASRVPVPPVDMSAVYDGGGMIDLTLFEAALDALEE